MTLAVQPRDDLVAKDEEKGWQTLPVHGNSKRLCTIKRFGEACGAKATLVTSAIDGRHRRRIASIYHCNHPRHIANAHKQITEAIKNR